MKLVSLVGFISFLFVFFGAPSLAQDKLISAGKKFVNDPELAHAAISMAVYDLDQKKYLFAHNSSMAIPPASTVKLFATSTALEILGPSYRCATRLYSTNHIQNGQIDHLWIRGGGDISLGSRFYEEEDSISNFLKAWADELYKKGLRQVNGNIIGDGSEFSYQGGPDGWTWSDMGNYYGSPPSGLPVYDNMLRYYFKVSGRVGTSAELVRVFPEIKGLEFTHSIESARVHGDHSYIYGAPYSYVRMGVGRLPRNSEAFMVKGSIPDPEFQFASELKRVLQERGIKVIGEAKGFRTMEQSPAKLRYKGLTLLHTHYGESISSIATWTNMRSVNVFAEQLISLVAHESGQSGSTGSATRFLMTYWGKRIETGGLNLRDGSGLSRSNAVSAQNYCSLLEYMHLSKHKDVFRATLPVAGESGTMRNICKNGSARGRIQAKSGTMNRIKSYSGYVNSANNRKLAFAILVNNHTCSNWQLVKKMEHVFNTMASL
ncbi:MAG: D-alanyl-D-alanine carboxypeptidase/D-alanyl-D-alanine-endopeptidase [Bacteroidetes bacterium]|nr:MAG: D-alanyl-D-alanine carboxypeptidase/D-alanyl-D-alanine-endopeptidase [Bacteroidota bacterium]